MKRQHPIVALAGMALAGILAAGCKKDEAADAGGNADGAAVAVPEGRGAPEVAGQVATVNKALEQDDYDAALSALVQARQAEGAMNDAQRRQYEQALQNTTLKLIEAAKTDPKAQEAYQNLGRMITGR